MGLAIAFDGLLLDKLGLNILSGLGIALWPWLFYGVDILQIDLKLMIGFAFV